ncbi:YitT family protein [Thermanaeromonas sp. C210]|uniref:YitT family protein n=1 Tax=Thermanaeromonas sp. C210 TaxID=2731925 RepID=UPI00155D02D6|nr:YitT family protein [Thermanaeromonas sp. C210]GFN22740.1 membrane protein [Thermanaeromonas sp. C210]
MSKKLEREIRSYIGITAGCFLTGLGLVLFLVPNKIAAGGVSGLATVLYHIIGVPVGLTMLVLNVPLFMAGLKVLGLRFGVKTLYGTVALSLLTDALSLVLRPATFDSLLAAIYGGILTGVGLGVVFRSGGSTGGTDLAALLFRRFTSLSAGMGLLVVDALVIALAGIVFGMELALYALLALFLASRAIDTVQEGGGFAKAAVIISDHSAEIARRILTDLDRGATGICGRGVYTNRGRELLLVVVQRAEVTRLKNLVAEVDPRAFVIVSNVHEVLGEGFREWRDN